MASRLFGNTTKPCSPVFSLSRLREQDRNLDFPFDDLPCVHSRFCVEDTTEAKAYIVVAVSRIVVVTIGNGAVVGIVIPATAAFHPVRPAC